MADLARYGKKSQTISRTVIAGLLVVLLIAALGGSESLPSYLYSIRFENVRIYNPIADSNQYPDELVWSPGGEAVFGLQALIACNKPEGFYLPDEVIAVRSGVKNISDSIVQLGLAYCSPNKHGIPPEYTLFIDGPYNRPLIFGYLGDDAIYGGPRKKLENMVSVAPDKVFNPSSDGLYYNISDGFFKFATPGIYRFWFSYSFDSLTSSLIVPETAVTSDTIEIRIINNELIFNSADE